MALETKLPHDLQKEEKRAREGLAQLRERELELEEEIVDSMEDRNQLEKDFKQYVSDQDSSSSKKLARLKEELQVLRTRTDINNRLIKIQAKEREIKELTKQLDQKSEVNIEKKRRRMDEIISRDKESVEEKEGAD